MIITDEITCLKGIGPKKAERLAAYDIFTVEDLLRYFPKRYQDRTMMTRISDLQPGATALIRGRITSRSYSGYRYKRRAPLTLKAADDTGSVKIVFFNGNYLKNTFKTGQEYFFYGKVTENRGRFQMVHPEFFNTANQSEMTGIVPVYPLPEGFSQNEMRKIIRQSLESSEMPDEWLPEQIVQSRRVADPGFAFRNIHFPGEKRHVLMARYRFIFEELLTLETGLMYIRRGTAEEAAGIRIESSAGEDFIGSLPFTLTDGQSKVWYEIAEDLKSDVSMNRLVQGDVGSGKTVIAEIAIYTTVLSGYQAVMMAPTEILAEQHYETLNRDFGKFGIRVSLLTGSMKPAEKRGVLDALSTGATDVLIGTHALIQPDVRFHDLGLVVTDEQHRFGVRQRHLLSEKGNRPNTMVMTATPIPRTLAVVLYGELDISVIHTLPAERKPVRTFSQRKKDRGRIYDFVGTQLAAGHQAFVVTPLIGESDKIEARSAEEVYDELKKRFREFQVALLHGVMKQEEKNRIMSDFSQGKIDLLVSTVVVEVGIDVRNATVMVLENCERFGLAQMHQLRGRVGRGSNQSYCFLIVENESELAAERAKILTECHDGFQIAEEDLRLRGPGEIFGTRQHGLPEMHIGDIVRHHDVLEDARLAARDILNADPDLAFPEHAELKKKIRKMFGENIRLEI